MSITFDIPENIDTILNQRSREEHIDKISVLKKMLREGAEYYLVNQYSKGRISKGKLAEFFDMDLYEIDELLEKYHVKSSISYKRFTKGIGIAENVLKIE